MGVPCKLSQWIEGEAHMNESRRIMLATLGWVGAISGLHAWLNVDWAGILNDMRPEGKRKLNVAYIPVT